MRRPAPPRIAAGTIALAAILPLSREAAARSCRVTLIPNGTRNTCANCHVSRLGGGAVNPFGSTVRPLVGQVCRPFWGPDIASMDSDGDGLTNGEELGDPLGAWTSGQPAPGIPTRVLNPGVKDAPAAHVRGDANADGLVDVSDAVALLEVLFAGRSHAPCMTAEDLDDNEKVEVNDAVYLLEFLFSGGPPPAAPFPACASVPSRLRCTSHGPCD